MLYDILLDIGGTGIKGSFFSVEHNTISDTYPIISDSDKEKDVIIRHFSDICNQIWDKIGEEDKRIRSIRMAFPGPFDYKKGISKMKGLAKYESLYEVSIPREMLDLSTKENTTFLPKSETDFKFMNDVEAYALGVMHKRKFLQGYRVIYLCIGTGCGSAYSVDGRISYDRAQGIPENGWVYPIPFKASRIDDYISVRGMNKLAQKYCNKVQSPLELSLMVKNGDENAIKAYREFGEDLKSALLPQLIEFGANTFVIGGNISHSSEMFLSPIEESCKELGIDIVIESDTSRLIMMGLAML
jgi:glucokinase